MELKTIEACDVALHYLDTILGDHRREYSEATEKSHEYTLKANMAYNQLNITHDQIREIEQRKKELCQQ